MKTSALSVPLFVLLVACGHSKEQAPTAADVKIAVDQAPVPARYSAPLPNSLAALEMWIQAADATTQGDSSAPPVSHTVDSILNGDARWMSRFSTAANAVPATEAAAYAAKWSELFRLHAPGRAFCAQARPIMAGPPATARVALANSFAESCAGDEDLPLIVRADTPAQAVVTFYDPFRFAEEPATPTPFDPRLVEAAREVILRGKVREARAAAFVLANRHDTKVDAALVAIHSGLKDQERADQVAMAFIRTMNAQGLARAKAACTRMPNDPMCHPLPTIGAPPPQDAEAASDSRNLTGDGAVGLVRPSADAIKAKVAALQAAGFTRLDPSKMEKLDSDAPENILLSAGLAHWFDVETDRYPNQHDSLMRTLALLVAPTLQDAVFEETPPGAEDESIPYELTAYAGGKRYRVKAKNYGDWYDVVTVIALLNKIMEDLDAPERFTALDSTDQTLTIVAATPATIAKARQAGLLKIGEDARDAERRGKAFEVEVREELQRGKEAAR